jgi:hypothetical protein
MNNVGERRIFTAGSLYDRNGIVLPILGKFWKLGEGGHIGHPIQKYLPDQVIHFVLNTDGVEIGCFDIQRFAMTIQRLNPHD